MAALAIEGLSKSFGAVSVIDDLHLSVEAGERRAVIGPNGAGKTTLFNLVTGWLRPDSGAIRMEGADISALSPQAITRRGLARSFQRNTLLDGLTVRENLRLAVQAAHSSRFQVFRDRRRYPEVLEEAESIAERMELTAALDARVIELSYGQKRQLEVAMALCSRPRILLLDEPAAGTSPAERATLIRLVSALPRSVTLVLVEHDMDVVFEVCERITVLSYGRLIVTGAPEEVRANQDVRDAYLGRSRA